VTLRAGITAAITPAPADLQLDCAHLRTALAGTTRWSMIRR
jgi:hypothetical protein